MQGTEAWLRERVGKVTASRMGDLMARTKTGWGASRANYMAELIAERLTGEPVDQFQSAAMKRGTELEPQARSAYEFFADTEVEMVGFVPHPTIEMCGASPDGLVGGEGLVEFKCPNTATHIETILGAKIPADYIDQMQWQMACRERAWCDFVSFDPRLPPKLMLFTKRLARDEKRIAELTEATLQFLSELNDKLAALKAIT